MLVGRCRTRSECVVVFIVDASRLSVGELGAGVLSRVGRHGVTSVRGGLVNRGRGGGGLGILSSARAPTSLRRFDFCIRAEG